MTTNKTKIKSNVLFDDGTFLKSAWLDEFGREVEYSTEWGDYKPTGRVGIPNARPPRIKKAKIKKTVKIDLGFKKPYKQHLKIVDFEAIGERAGVSTSTVYSIAKGNPSSHSRASLVINFLNIYLYERLITTRDSTELYLRLLIEQKSVEDHILLKGKEVD